MSDDEYADYEVASTGTVIDPGDSDMDSDYFDELIDSPTRDYQEIEEVSPISVGSVGSFAASQNIPMHPRYLHLPLDFYEDQYESDVEEVYPEEEDYQLLQFDPQHREYFMNDAPIPYWITEEYEEFNPQLRRRQKRRLRPQEPPTGIMVEHPVANLDTRNILQGGRRKKPRGGRVGYVTAGGIRGCRSGKGITWNTYV
jgi:hypothetical protein